ncbi:hypothetical protein FRC12_002918, partial [Ceratobasidium sp. 428]
MHSLFLAALTTVAVVKAGNTTCKTTSLDWYTRSVGETPCRTYERLLQTCDSKYQVGNFPPTQPPDTCDTQVSTCCCNSISFALSMLCQNCQYGVGSGTNGDTGDDAKPGSYGVYLGKCSPITNQSLPNTAQTAACNQGISIPNYLYTLFWNQGDWYYEYTRQTADLQIQSKQNGTKCAAPKPPASGSNSSGRNVGAIVG